jgi:hypothetical protein
VVTQASVEWLGHDHDVPLAEPVALASLLLQLDSLTTAPHGIGRPNLARNRVRTTQ